MKGTKSRMFRMLAALLCAVLLCVTPVLSLAAQDGAAAMPDAMQAGDGIKPGELLTARLLQALVAERRIDGTMKMGLGQGLKTQLSAEEFSALNALVEAMEWRFFLANTQQAGVLGFAMAMDGETVIDGAVTLNEEGIALETNLLPGKILKVSYMELLGVIQSHPLFSRFDIQSAQVVVAALQDIGGSVAGWAEGVAAAGGATVSEETVAATEKRDASTEQASVRLTGQQQQELYDVILSTLLPNTQLHEVLGKLFDVAPEEIAAGLTEIQDEFASLSPTDGVVKMDAFINDAGELVGLDYAMPELFEEIPVEGAMEYNRLSGDASATHTFDYNITDYSVDEEGQKAGLSLRYAYDESQPSVRVDDMAMAMTVDGTTIYAYTYNGTGERNGQTDSLSAEGVTSMDGVVMRVTYDSVTEALEGDDFTSDLAMSMNIFGQEVMVANYTLASSAYEPADDTGKTVVEVLQLSEEEMGALGQEFIANVMQKGFAMMSRIPAETLTMFINMASLPMSAMPVMPEEMSEEIGDWDMPVAE